MCHYVENDDPPAFWSETYRKARKDHRCGECGGPIPKGTRYFVASWASERGSKPYRHAAHEECMDLVQHIQIELCGQDGYVIGSLIADVDEHIGEHPEIGVTLAAIRAKYGAKVEATAPRGGG